MLPRTIPTIEMQQAYEKAVGVFADGVFADGEIETLDRKTVGVHLIAIANNVTGDDAVQSRDMIQAITLNHLVLQRFVNELEQRTARMQNFVLWLTIASVIGTFVQVWLAFR